MKELETRRNRRVERQITARDLAERLLPDLNMNELLLWAPDLFAYTSYIMSQTATYQVVVSPPTGKIWSPQNREIKDFIKDFYNSDKKSGEIYKWLNSFLEPNTKKNVKDFSESGNAEKWIFDPENWNPLNEYFENRLRDWISYNKKKDPAKTEDFKEVLDQIAFQINHGVEESLKVSLLEREKDRIKRQRSQNIDYTELDTEKKLEEVAENELKKIKFVRPELKEYFLEGKKWSEIEFALVNRDNEKEEKSIYDKYCQIISRIEKEKQEERIDYKDSITRFRTFSLFDLLQFDYEQNWIQLVQMLGDEWALNLNKIEDKDFFVINDGERKTSPENEIGDLYKDENGRTYQWHNEEVRKRYLVSNDTDFKGYINREKDVLGILLKHTPPLLIAIWAYFYNEVTDKTFYGVHDRRELRVSELLCNQDHLQGCELNSPENNQQNIKLVNRLWKISIFLMTMHATADICCTSWGLKSVEPAKNDNSESQLKKKDEFTAQLWAERILFSKGSLATINPERCRVVPKRHNPQVGITLRSISSNLAFHRSSVEVVWRKSSNTRLEKYLDDEGGETISVLLIPYPFEIKSKDFKPDHKASVKVGMAEDYKFFGYEPDLTEIDETAQIEKENKIILNIIEDAEKELGGKNPYVDAVIFPETALSKNQFDDLENRFLTDERFGKNSPSLLIAGVRESRKNVADELNEKLSKDKQQKVEADQINFVRNAVYCKYFHKNEESNTSKNSGYGNPQNDDQIPKYKQYKHHRWKLDASQIDRYGLSQILDDSKFWWESIKIPRRRVSFLNVGRKITIANLICEDLARQDPIADLIRYVGPSLVVTLLMDGPQLRSRWSSRYASILSDDPGSSVITLTSWGMVKRHSSNFGLMSRVVALWSESDSGMLREIELAEGAKAILLNLRLSPKKEKTADGRQERLETTVLRLKDVIQIYSSKF